MEVTAAEAVPATTDPWDISRYVKADPVGVNFLAVLSAM